MLVCVIATSSILLCIFTYLAPEGPVEERLAAALTKRKAAMLEGGSQGEKETSSEQGDRPLDQP